MFGGLSEGVNDTSAVYMYEKIDLQLHKQIEGELVDFLERPTFANLQTSAFEPSGHNSLQSGSQCQIQGSASVPAVLVILSSVQWIGKTHNTQPEDIF